MKKIFFSIIIFVFFSINSCSSLRSVEDTSSSNNEIINKNIQGIYNLTISFGNPYGDIDVSLELYYDKSQIKSRASYFDGQKNVPVQINNTELFEGAIFINLVDSEAGNVEMEVYFDDENSISGFYAGQFEFKGERIK